MEVSKCWEIVEFHKISIKMKNFETFTSPKQPSAWRKLFKLPTREMYRMFLEWKFSNGDLQEYTEICFPSARRMQFLGVQKYFSVNIFFDTNQKNVFAEYIFYKAEWVDVRKMSELFWVKLYRKMSDLFCYLYLALTLSTRKSEISI